MFFVHFRHLCLLIKELKTFLTKPWLRFWSIMVWHRQNLISSSTKRLYLGISLSVTLGQTNFVTSPLSGNGNIQMPFILEVRVGACQLPQLEFSYLMPLLMTAALSLRTTGFWNCIRIFDGGARIIEPGNVHAQYCLVAGLAGGGKNCFLPPVLRVNWLAETPSGRNWQKLAKT